MIDLVARDELFFVGDEFQSIYRFRHADVEVFKERREPVGEVLPLTQNWRSRPEVLEVVNQLFAATFGDEFQRLVAAGRFPDPASGPAVELLVTDKASYRDTGVALAAGEARRSRAACRSSSTRARPSRARSCCSSPPAPTRSSTRRSCAQPACRPTARPVAATSASSRSRPARLPAAAAQPLRRRGACHRARLAVRRRLQRRARAAASGCAAPPALHGHREGAAGRPGRARPAAGAGVPAALRTPRRERRHGRPRALCEQIVVEHDYDLAVLAQWDGRRRYANLRKLARLARSYEELRGPDIEGFVRFVLEQDAAGVKELEAVAEEEGAGAVRLLTIHAAKGLEFKVVVVADAGRARPKPSGEEIICLPDGRFGFKVVDPATGKREAGVRLRRGARRRGGGRGRGAAASLLRRDDARDRQADRRRLRRLGEARHPDTDRLGARAARGREELERTGVLVARPGASRAADRPLRGPRPRPPRRRSRSQGQLSLFEAAAPGPGPTVAVLRRSSRSPCRRERVRAALLQRARTVRALPVPLLCRAARRAAPVAGSEEGLRAGPGASPPPRSATRCTGCWSASTSARPRRRRSTRCCVVPGGESAEELERIGLLVDAFCGSTLASRLAALTASPRSGRSRSSTTGCSSTAASTSSTSRGARPRRRLQVELARRARPRRGRRGRVPAPAARLRARVLPRRRGAGRGRLPVPRTSGRPGSATFTRDQVPELEAELSAAIARIQAGQFPPTAERVRVRGVPCARRRLRRPELALTQIPEEAESGM